MKKADFHMNLTLSVLSFHNNSDLRYTLNSSIMLCARAAEVTWGFCQQDLRRKTGAVNSWYPQSRGQNVNRNDLVPDNSQKPVQKEAKLFLCNLLDQLAVLTALIFLQTHLFYFLMSLETKLLLVFFFFLLLFVTLNFMGSPGSVSLNHHGFPQLQSSCVFFSLSLYLTLSDPPTHLLTHRHAVIPGPSSSVQYD